MPELPEVETICRDLRQCLTGRTIQSVCISLPRLIKEPQPAAFVRLVRGSRIRDIGRKGKTLIITLRTAGEIIYYMIIHLRMTGQLIASRREAFGQVIFNVSGGWFLCYNDPRTLGELRVVRSLSQIELLKKIGPEPLAADFTAERFRTLLNRRRGSIKSLLLNQRVIAGIGNIYACEGLFQAGIRPERSAQSLTRREAMMLYESMRKVLRQAIKLRGTSVRTYRDGKGKAGTFSSCLAVYGRAGERCASCEKVVRRVVVSGRGTFYCPGCQR